MRIIEIIKLVHDHEEKTMLGNNYLGDYSSIENELTGIFFTQMMKYHDKSDFRD